ncbi:MerR family transcriptional regulator [Pseudonocardia sp. MH-G8]|uniref:MerR family transcriptional regulator n=1 Tax=Pseudonocardia sp. MH-G8 TaxID=1854588 RepID=UPI000BA0DE38|nr:MerR family transcriptional regulator [Pseudonocardia sp. MH-G8]OZM75377.1 MerR family transcriptional regulator [Pseudonocardia sp. MH-G8]
MSRALRSGQLAKAAGVNAQTLRYYERRGLLPEPRRTLGGHREYGPEAVTVLRVIRGLARLGFTLSEISELIEVGAHRGPRPGLRDAAATKLAEVDAKIADLNQVRASLADVLSAGCSDLAECSCTPGCPIPFADIDPGTGRTPTTDEVG